MTRKAFQWEKVARALIDAGGFTLSADEITKRTGVRQPARRIHELREDKGVPIQSVAIDPANGIHGYKTTPDARQMLLELLNESAPKEPGRPTSLGSCSTALRPRRPVTTCRTPHESLSVHRPRRHRLAFDGLCCLHLDFARIPCGREAASEARGTSTEASPR